MAEVPSSCDVVVIGGGPAGSVAASLLAKSGLDVVLLDKAQHPRFNVGEALIPHVWRFFDLIDVSSRVMDAGFLVKGGGMGVWSDCIRRVRFSDFGFDRPALHVERAELDHILLTRAMDWGVRVFQKISVVKVDFQSDGVTVHHRSVEDGAGGMVHAKYVVDASGQSAVVARQLGLRKFDDAFQFMSVWGYYKRGRVMSYEGKVFDWEQRFEVKPPTIQARLDHDWSWCWYIPLKSMLSAGVVLPTERFQAFRAAKDTPEAKFREILKKHPLIGKLIDDDAFIEGNFHVIKDYAYKPTELAVDRCYLAGDAAAFVDPINSAGVSFSAYAGHLAAWAITSSLAKPARREHYRKMFALEYGRRLALFRYSAAPDDADVEDCEPLAAEALRMNSHLEQQLIFHQTLLTSRATRFRKLFERLGLDQGDHEKTTIPIPDID